MLSLSIFKHPNIEGKYLSFFLNAFWWKFNQVFIKKPVLLNITKSIICICDPDSSYSGLVFLTGLPEFYAMKFMLEHLGQNSIFIDVGANIGVYSLLAADRIRKGKIYSFEVDKHALSSFYKNIALNGLSNIVRVEEKLVSNKNGNEYYVEEKQGETNHIQRVLENHPGRKVKSISLDRYLDNIHIDKVDIIKIDVEGAEFKVLKGLKNYLKRNKIKIIILEINKKIVEYGSNPYQVISFLKNFGYHGFMFSKRGKLIEIVNNEKVFKDTENFIFLR